MTFGCEQKWAQERASLSYLYGTLGEFRFPMRFRALILDRLLPRDFHPATIWDAGCGEGQTTFMLSRRFPEAQITGTDVNIINIERCRQIAKKARAQNVTFLQVDLVKQSFPADLVVCFEVLEHIENYKDALKNLTGSLSTGGFLVIHTPADTVYQSETWGLRRFMKNGYEGHVSHHDGHDHVRPGFVLDQLKEEIADLGLAVTKATYTFGRASMHAHTIYEWTRSRSKVWQILTLFPLMSIASIEGSMPVRTGGGISIVAQRVAD
jgi:trans-aconitate methyltransferase